MIEEMLLGFALGMLVGIWITWLYLRRSYDGLMDVIVHEDRKVFSLVLNEEPEILEKKKAVVFKVKYSGEVRG